MPRPKKVDQLWESSHDTAICEEQIVHVDAVRAVRAALPGVPTIAGLSALFGALSDPTRLRIIAVLAIRELCVCDLAAALGMSQSAVSHQLRNLRQLGLVKAQRQGRRAYYALDDEHVTNLFDQALNHIDHQVLEAAHD